MRLAPTLYWIFSLLLIPGSSAYLHVFHFHLDALNVSEHAKQIVESIEDATLLFEQFHQLLPFLHDLHLSGKLKTSYFC